MTTVGLWPFQWPPVAISIPKGLMYSRETSDAVAFSKAFIIDEAIVRNGELPRPGVDMSIFGPFRKYLMKRCRLLWPEGRQRGQQKEMTGIAITWTKGRVIVERSRVLCLWSIGKLVYTLSE